MLCKVYIHDLELTTENKVRQKLLMSGARFATSLRFINDLNDADLWILRKDSALLSYAKKRASTHYLSLWVCDEDGQLFSIKNPKVALGPGRIAQTIDIVTLQLHKKESDRVVVEIRETHNSELVNSLRSGFEKKQGKLFLQYEQAQILIDFSDMTVGYNDFCYKLLWGKKSAVVDFTAFEMLPPPSNNLELEHVSSAFSIGWQIMHNSKDDRLIIPLTENTVLKLDEWPSFEHVNHDFEDYRIASFLQKRSFSANQIITLLKLPEKQVYSFFNAIYITGIARVVDEQSAVLGESMSKDISNGLVGLWRKVRSALQIEKE